MFTVHIEHTFSQATRPNYSGSLNRWNNYPEGNYQGLTTWPAGKETAGTIVPATFTTVGEATKAVLYFIEGLQEEELQCVGYTVKKAEPVPVVKKGNEPTRKAEPLAYPSREQEAEPAGTGRFLLYLTQEIPHEGRTVAGWYTTQGELTSNVESELVQVFRTVVEALEVAKAGQWEGGNLLAVGVQPEHEAR